MESISIEEFKSKLGKRIKQLRKNAGYTQGKLAIEIGYKDKQVISEYEVNGANPTAFTLMQLAKALDTTLDDLIDFSKLELD